MAILLAKVSKACSKGNKKAPITGIEASVRLGTKKKLQIRL